MPPTDDHDPQLERAIDEAARLWLREATAQHPDTEVLIAYQEGRSTEAESAAIREHVSLCSACAEEIEALERFDRAEPDPIDEEGHEESWRRFQARRDALYDEALVDRQPARTRSSPLLLAASIFFALVGLASLYVAHFTDSPGDPVHGPLLVAELSPDGVGVERDVGAEAEVRAPAEAETIVLVALVGDQALYDAFELVLRASDGTEISRQRALRDERGRFPMLVPRSRVPNGPYRLTLWGVVDDDRREIATYSLRIVDGR